MANEKVLQRWRLGVVMSEDEYGCLAHVSAIVVSAIVKDDNGKFVKHSDHAALVEKLLGVLRRYREGHRKPSHDSGDLRPFGCREHVHYFLDQDQDCRCADCKMVDDLCKRADQLLKGDQ